MMKTNEAPEKIFAAFPEPETGAHSGPDWGGLIWLALLVAAGLIAFEGLEHYLFPHLDSFQHQAATIFVGTFAAVVGTYYATRRLNRALSLHAQAEQKLAL